MQVLSKARLRYVSIPPRKMRLVADMVKGLPVQEALDVLNFTPRIAARHLAKTVKSAAANALSQEGTDHLRPENLMITNIIVDEAPTSKRIRYQSMGRVFRYRKRFSHLTVFLEGQTDVIEEAPRRSRKAEAAEEEAPKAAKSRTTKKKATKKKTTKKKVAKKKTAAGTDKAKSTRTTKAKKKSATKKTAKSRKSSAADEEE